MKTIEYSFILRAATPISHHQGTDGNVGILHREKIALPNGEHREVPDVSGNAMRNGIRRALADLELDALGLLRQGSFDSADSVRFLYNGGAGSGSEGTIKLDEIRAMHQLIPGTAILGGTSRGAIHEGRLDVEPAILICSESESLLMPWQIEELADVQIKPSSEYEALREEYRHDETAKPRGRFLLTDAALALVNERAAKRERAADAEDEVAAQEARGGMMPHSAEEVIRGSLWTWSVVAHLGTDLEEMTVKAGLSAFLRRAVIGGGKRVGRGRFVVHASRGFDHLRPAEALRAMSLGELSGPEHEAPFVAHVKKRADEARAWLGVK